MYSRRITYIFLLFIILLSFMIGIYYYPEIPEKVASHWNGSGEVDGYTSKFNGIFIMPIVSIFLFILYFMTVNIDVLKKNKDKFKEYFNIFIIIVMLFLFYIFVLTLHWNLGYKFDMIKYLIPAFSILIYYCGILLSKTKRNKFIGIKTPWTLNSDEVWDKTHKLGAILFKFSGIISILGLIFYKKAIFLVLIPIISSTVFLFIYSYIIYKKKDN